MAYREGGEEGEGSRSGYWPAARHPSWGEVDECGNANVCVSL